MKRRPQRRRNRSLYRPASACVRLTKLRARVPIAAAEWDKHQMAALFPHPALTPEQEMHLRQQEAWVGDIKGYVMHASMCPAASCVARAFVSSSRCCKRPSSGSQTLTPRCRLKWSPILKQSYLLRRKENETKRLLLRRWWRPADLPVRAAPLPPVRAVPLSNDRAVAMGLCDTRAASHISNVEA